MTRKKVKLAFIVDYDARKASYEKRKKGLLKKIEELTILCGIEACAIIYNDYLDHQQPEIWPSPWGVQSVLSKLRRFPPEEQCKNMLNQKTYMKQRVNKAKEHLEKVRKDNREKEMSLLMNRYLSDGKMLDNLSMVDLSDLTRLISEKQNEINDRLSTLNENLASTSRTQPTNLEVGEKQVVILADEVTKQGQDRGKRVLEMNMDATQDIPWYLYLINDGEDQNQFLPFGDFNCLHN